MPRDTYDRKKKGDEALMSTSLYTGQRAMTLRERLEQNSALQNARIQKNTDSSSAMGTVNNIGSANKAVSAYENNSKFRKQTEDDLLVAESDIAVSLRQQHNNEYSFIRNDIQKQEQLQEQSATLEKSTEWLLAFEAERELEQEPEQETMNFPQDEALIDEIVESLALILEQETLLYRDAFDISEKKTEVIVKGKIEELDSLVKAEQAIILKIGRLESEREAVINELSKEMGFQLEGITLSEINAQLGQESYQRLHACQHELVETLGGLKNTNDTNAQLIQNALDYVNFSVNLITADQNAGNMYSQSGEDDAMSYRKNIFDIKL